MPVGAPRFSVEQASSADSDDLAALHYLSHTTSFAEFASPEWVAARQLEDYRRQWRSFFRKNDPRSRAWVARSGGRVIGMVRISPEKEEGLAQLTSMHVHPDFQGLGTGRALMSTAETFIRDSGYQRAILGVILANARARRLYERSGWAVLEERPMGVEGVPIAIYGKRFG